MNQSGSTKARPFRFGEFLQDNDVITDEQLLEALADHWSHGDRFGTALSRRGILTPEQVERWAGIYHDVVENLTCSRT